jgi:(E)-4-hydroxy-3-methylbut-2-enyl-diphosphate synthase
MKARTGSVTAHRRPTRQIRVGELAVGGGAPVSVQSMTNTATADLETTLNQVRALTAAGCEVVRVSVPDDDSLTAFEKLRENVRTPLVADIHFDHELAVGSLKAGADAVRINPGNIGAAHKVEEIVRAAGDLGASIRIGVNAGSLERDILKEHGHPGPAALVKSALRSIELVEGFGFNNMKISVKASDPLETVAAYRMLSDQVSYPLHLGVTEAGTPMTGAVRSSAALGLLLADGIGDTIRFSLSGDPVPEVHAAMELLRSLGLRAGPRVVACPTCARAEIDVAAWAVEVEEKVANIKAPLRIAVMGCPVNGPGEAREADAGLAGGTGHAILFARGKVVKKVGLDEAVDVLMEEVDKLAKDY